MILRKPFSVVLFTFLSFFSVCHAQQTNAEAWKINYDKGIEFYASEDYEQSLISLEKAFTIAQKTFPKNDVKIGNTANKLGNTYAQLEKYAEAIEIIKRAIAITKLNQGIENKQFIFRTSSLATIYYYNNNNELALESYEQAIVSASITNGKDASYSTLLKDKAEVYFFMGKYENSAALLKTSLSILDSLANKELDYASTLSDLARTYHRLGKFKEAITLRQQASKIILEKEGKNQGDYALNLSGLAASYIEMGEYDKAIQIQEESLSLYDSVQKNSREYALGLNGLAKLNAKIGDYKNAERLYLEVLKIITRIFPPNTSAFGEVFGSLGMVYERIGDYQQAIDFSEKALQNTLASTGKEHPAYGLRLYNLAFIYGNLGEYDKSLAYYLEALAVYKNTLGTTHIEYGKLVNNIGKLYYQQNELELALNYFQEAIKNLLLENDKNHPYYAYYLNDLANCQFDLGNYNVAIALMKENLKTAPNATNTNEESTVSKEYSLANAYNKTGNYEEARILLEPAIAKMEALLGIEHEDYGKLLTSLAESYIGLDKINLAIPILKLSNENSIIQLNEIFKFRSEIEKQAFLHKLATLFDQQQSIALKNPDKEELSAMNLQNQILLKGLLLNNAKDVLNKLSVLNDSLIDQKILHYRSLKTNLTKRLNQNLPVSKVKLDSIKNTINNLEIELVKVYSANFDEPIEFKNWKTSQHTLKDNEVAIEFSHFKYYDKGKATDSILYVAYVYKKAWNYPKLVRLFEEKQLSKILSKKNPNQLYAARGAIAVTNKNYKGIYRLIWQPLEKLIKKGDRVFFSPSGLLNQIPFAALTKKEGQNLNTRYTLVQLSSTAVLSDKITQPSLRKTLLIGGIDYNSETKTTAAATTTGWDYLPGTLTEITAIQTILESNQKEKLVLTATNATERRFKEMSSKSPSVLHIATHGFFFENATGSNKGKAMSATEEMYRLADDPLLRSGLIFAGANERWVNNKIHDNKDDGILTSMEISNLDLSTTDIVILSACETGLGDIEGNEGVYGLQRAFKMAGVNIVVMSLWQVPDTETAEFMELFYSNWIRTDDVRESFANAQRKMQRKYKNEPLKWAAFVLFE